MIAMYLGNKNGVAKAVYSIEIFHLVSMRIAVESKDKCFKRIVYDNIEDFINDWDCHVCDCKIDTDDARIKNEQNTAKEKPVLISQKEALERSKIGVKRMIEKELEEINEKIIEACDKGDTSIILRFKPNKQNIEKLEEMDYLVNVQGGYLTNIEWDTSLQRVFLEDKMMALYPPRGC